MLGEFNLFTFQLFLDQPFQVLVICRMDLHEVGYFHKGTVTCGETCKKRMKHIKHGETSVRGIREICEVRIMQNNSSFKS